MLDESAPVFSVAADLREGSVRVAVVGELDVVSVPVWSALVDAAGGDVGADLVLDFSAVTFADAAALGVIATVCASFDRVGRSVAIRGGSHMLRRMLSVTGLDAVLDFDDADPVADDNNLREAESSALAADGTAAASTVDLVRVGSTSSNDVVDAALRLVTALADATVEHADGVSVTLERHGRLMTVAASNDKVLAMDGHQYDTGQGPCLAAKAEGRWFYIESLEDETRWPAFVPLALEQGIHSILSSPLLTADRPLGALNIYSTTVNAFGTHEQELAALFATQASDILTSAHADVSEAALAHRLTEALTARQLIARAEGALMAVEGVDAAAAASMLRRRARGNRITVAEQAALTLSGGPTQPSDR
ncbi:MAG: transcription antitermination regulator [Ilumatobacteraceae bacterium]|nr:transcription antitermination regulator [Ilumatobacteraceae bacterium]